MDAIRRGAMMRMGRGLLGLGAAASQVSRGARTGDGVALKSAAHKVPWRGADPTTPSAPSPSSPNPLDQARHAAAEPLRRKVNELYGYEGWKLSTQSYMAGPQNYLEALRSTAGWWRVSVTQDRAKATQDAVARLEGEIRKIFSSPFDAVEQTAKDALAAFLSEINL